MAYLYPLVVWVVFRVFGLLFHLRRDDQAVGSGGFCLTLLLLLSYVSSRYVPSVP
jgi:hypothetical protein